MTNLAHIGETALLLLSAYLLGCVLGYAARRILHAGRGTRQVTVAMPQVAIVPAPIEAKRPRSPAARLAASVEDLPPARPPTLSPPPPATTEPARRRSAPEKATSKTKSATAKPSVLSTPRGGVADNLKQIKGIGPKIEASLHAMGIFHIDQIAAWNKTDIDWVEAQLAFKGRIRRERWVEQALELGKVKASA